MVSKHQPKIASADDKISGLSTGDRWFRSINQRLQVQMIRYRTYRLEVMVLERQPKIANVDDKISDLSARSDGSEH